jgi:hypothetical protein
MTGPFTGVEVETLESVHVYLGRDGDGWDAWTVPAGMPADQLVQSWGEQDVGWVACPDDPDLEADLAAHYGVPVRPAPALNPLP